MKIRSLAALLLLAPACGSPTVVDSATTSTTVTTPTSMTQGDSGETDGDECGGCPDGSECVDGMCQAAGCEGGCPGLSYCDLATNTCQPGCAFDDQCPNGTCDVATHTCVCADGFVACGTECIPEDEVCEDSCGDGVLDGNETCDGAALGGATCESLGYVGGELACESNCTAYDTSGCVAPSCGDGIINQDSEDCDGSDLGGETCIGLGYEEGQLACAQDCTYDENTCGFGGLPQSGMYSACEDNSDCAGLICGFGYCTRPCMDDAECTSDEVGGTAEPACVEEISQVNSFCLIRCTGGLACPDGTFCDNSDFYDDMICRGNP